MPKYQSSKIFDGFSCVFRQWKATTTHCQFLHGYAISFKIYFEGELDNRNWVWDFGGMKRANTLINGMQPKVWMDYMFDHTVIIAEDDPLLSEFKMLNHLPNLGNNNKGGLQLRIIPATGAEKFAEYIYCNINKFVKEETDNRVRVTKVKFMEHGKNAAYYLE